MKKKTLKKALSLALSLTLIVSSITVYNSNAKAATLDEVTSWVADADYNLALNKVTTIYPGCAEGKQENLNNGALGGAGAHCALSTTGWGWSAESYAIIDLDDYYDASTLDSIIIQYKDAADNDTVISRSYKIEYSADGVDYYEAVPETHVYPVPEEGEAEGLTLDENRCTTDDVSGVTGTVRYVKVYYPTTAGYGIQITEIAVLAEDPQTVEVERCADAAGITVTSPDYNTIQYNITAGEGQEEYLYNVYLDGIKLVGENVSADVDYVLTGIATGTHTLKVIALYNGMTSSGIVSEEVSVYDVSQLITDTKNIANVNNNSKAEIIEISDIYVDEEGTYTLGAAQVALDGLYPTGEGATVALRTAAGVSPVTVVIDLGEYYRAAEFDKVLLAYSNVRTYVGSVTVEFSEDAESYTEVGNNTGYVCSIDNGGTAEVNAITLDEEKLNDYSGTVRYVKLTLSDGVNAWGYVINEIGVVMNTDTPVTGLAPKLNDIDINTETANTVNVAVSSTVGFEDAAYTAVLLDADDNEVDTIELSLVEGSFTGTFADVAKGTYSVKIVVSYEEGTKTIDKTVEDVVVENPNISTVTATSEEANNIMVTWEVTGYYADQVYNIYLDGKLYAEAVECEEDEEIYTITDVPAGTHSVSVSVVIGEDESELCTIEDITVNPVEITADDIFAMGVANVVYVTWEHSLIEGEEAEYTVSLKETGETATVDINEDGYFEYEFSNLPIGTYTVVITYVVNGVTMSVECEEVQTNIDYAVEPNTFKLFMHAEEEYLEPEYIIYFNDEEVVVTLDDFVYDEETNLYTYVKKLGKGTYDVNLSGLFDLCTAEIEDVVAAPVTNLKATKNGKNVELTWDAADAPEGQTYTVYVNKVPKAEGITDTKYTLTDVAAGGYAITVEALYVNPYSESVYRESADCEISIEEETTTEAPTTEAPTTVAGPTTGSNKETTTIDVNSMKKPGKVTVKKATKKLAAKKMSLKIKKVTGATGYKVAIYKTKKNAKKNVKAVATTTSSKINMTVKSKKIKNAKKLFVRVRAYVQVGDTKVTGKWSKVKKVNVK